MCVTASAGYGITGVWQYNISIIMIIQRQDPYNYTSSQLLQDGSVAILMLNYPSKHPLQIFILKRGCSVLFQVLTNTCLDLVGKSLNIWSSSGDN